MQIIYRINTGTGPFTASILPAEAPDQTPPTIGVYSFDDLPDQEYTLTVIDSLGCFDIIVVSSTITTTSSSSSTTTTTTGGITTTTTTTVGGELTPVSGDGPSASFESISCFAPTEYTLYTDATLVINVGDHIYSTSGIGSPVSQGWYFITDLNSVVRRYEIGITDGEVITINAC